MIVYKKVLLKTQEKQKEKKKQTIRSLIEFLCIIWSAVHGTLVWTVSKVVSIIFKSLKALR